MRNIVLIGMPGSGKSTLGVLLAKAMGFDFLDTDVLLQAREGELLQSMLDRDGIDAFLAKEEAAVLSVHCERTVIATGGSVVYSEEAIRHLRENGVIVYLSLSLEEIKRRLSNLATRGVALRPGQTLAGLYAERVPLYARASDVTLETDGLDVEQELAALIARLEEMMLDER